MLILVFAFKLPKYKRFIAYQVHFMHFFVVFRHRLYPWDIENLTKHASCLIPVLVLPFVNAFFSTMGVHTPVHSFALNNSFSPSLHNDFT
jgi:hypothetical protein